jgi:hypothetical protein
MGGGPISIIDIIREREMAGLLITNPAPQDPGIHTHLQGAMYLRLFKIVVLTVRLKFLVPFIKKKLDDKAFVHGPIA